jgi:dynein heavy chain 1, cytosolic
VSWLTLLQKRVEKYIEALPQQLDLLTRTTEAIKNPLFRFLEREITVASALLDQVREDL